jgi:hypothetical protein
MNGQLAFLFDDIVGAFAPAASVRDERSPKADRANRLRAGAPAGTTGSPSADLQLPPSPAPRPSARNHPRRVHRKWGRYAGTRRRPAGPKPFVGFGAYRPVVAGGLLHVIGPGGARCEPLTAWARSVLEPPESVVDQPGARAGNRKHDPAADARRVVEAMDEIRMLLDAINWVHATYPGVLMDLLDRKTAPAREIVRFWLTLRGCDIGNGRNRNSGKIAYPSSSDAQWEIGVTLSRFRQLFDFWNEKGVRVAHNPMQMDKDRSRIAGQTKQLKRNSAGRWFIDVDGLFRTKMIDRQAPRPHDASVAGKILARGREMGWPEEVSLKFETMYRTGARIGQTDALTGYGLLVRGKDCNHAAMIQKGSKGLLRWQCRVPPDLKKRLVARLAGFVKGGMKTLNKWAAPGNEVGHARLAKLYVFSTSGKAPTPAWRSAHLLRLVVDDLRLTFDIPRDDGEVVKRSFTSHWFRHAFVNGMLDRIAASAADAQRKEDLRQGFARYMGWKNHILMLEYYGRHHFEQETGLMVAEHQDALNDGLGDHFDDEDLLVPANDNAIADTRRVSGDLLD